MNIEAIATQQLTLSGAKDGASAAEANALFAELLGLADALLSGAGASGRDGARNGEELVADAQLVSGVTPFFPLAAATPTVPAGGLGADALAVADAAEGRDAPLPTQPVGNGAASVKPMPVEMPKTMDGVVPTMEEALAAARHEAEQAERAAASKPDLAPAKVEELVVKLAPTVPLAAPKVAPGPVASADKTKSASSPKPASEVSITFERAEKPERTEAARVAEQRAVTASPPAGSEQDASTPQADPENQSITLTTGTARATEMGPVDRSVQPQAAQHLPQQPPAHQIAHKLSKAVEAGEDRIRIELKPASLGHVEVQLRIADDGRVSAVVSADRADTLALLQSDVRGLEQALKDAGLRTDPSSLSFNLRQGDGHAGQQSDTHGQRRRGTAPAAFEFETVSGEAARTRTSLSGVDIRI